jgi:hypothetical protein
MAPWWMSHCLHGAFLPLHSNCAQRSRLHTKYRSRRIADTVAKWRSDPRIGAHLLVATSVSAENPFRHLRTISVAKRPA